MALGTDCTNQILGRLDPLKFLPTYPHSSVPCHNLQFNEFEGTEIFSEVCSEEFSKIPYHVSYPTPATFPAMIEKKVINSWDPALHLVKAKKYWENYKLQILKFCKKSKTGIDTSKKTAEVPLNVLLLTNHLSKDPDPYFKANYNSYFNGSNITCLDLGLDKYLIRPISYATGEIGISRLYLNDAQWDVEYKSFTRSNTEKPGYIYEIKTTSNAIITRQKRCISLFSLDIAENEFTVQKELAFEKDIPIVSVSSNRNNFCTVSAERELEIFDIMVGSPILQEKLYNEEEEMSDNWGSVHYVNNDTLCFLDRCSLNLIDLRVKAVVVKKWTIEDVTEHCEEVFAGATGSSELQYLVTSHQVLSLDIRVGFSQRWTHGIDHSPALISVLQPTSNHDTLFIGSQRNDTVILIENDCMKNKNYSKLHPYALPSLRDTFHLSRSNGYCLSNTVSSRFNMCLTGLYCLEDKGDITIFRATSVGDVFKQVLTKKNSQDSALQLCDRELGKLEEWEEQCEDLLLEQNNPCFVTGLLKDTNILHCIQSKGKLYEESVKEIDLNNAEWSFSKKELMSYCDYLAPRILEEWSIDEEEEWCMLQERDFNELSSDDEEDVTDRVTKWIEKYAADMETPINADFYNENKGMAENPISEDDDNENKGVKDDDMVYELVGADEKMETDLKINFSATEPSSQNEKITVSTPVKKFVSGF